jgi:Raf kinase inhibitor-like YbhB/YbcL family protein
VGFAITSPDFADGEDLEAWASANAFGGQCSGDNLNPALEWQELPEGTAAVAITMLDASAGNFVHWVHTDIPADVTSLERGGSTSLAGAPGRNQGDSAQGYFGPCPPGPNHRYIFTVWALDAPTGLEAGFSYYDWLTATKDHVLGSAEITGMYHGTA